MAFDPPCGLKAVAPPPAPPYPNPAHGVRPGGSPIAGGVVTRIIVNFTLVWVAGAAPPPWASRPQEDAASPQASITNTYNLNVSSGYSTQLVPYLGVPPGGTITTTNGDEEEKELEGITGAVGISDASGPHPSLSASKSKKELDGEPGAALIERNLGFAVQLLLGLACRKA